MRQASIHLVSDLTKLVSCACQQNSNLPELRLKILHINSGTMLNGALTYCKFLSEQLIAMGHDVTVLARPKSWLATNLDPKIAIRYSDQGRSPIELRRLANWIRSEQFDLIHTHMSRAHTLGVLMKFATGVPVIATAHNCSFQLHWRFNDLVLANSQATYDQHIKINRIHPDKMEVVHCFTELERFNHVEPIDVIRVRRQMRLNNNEFLIGVVGEVIPRKGQLFLVKALPKILEAIPNARVIFLGRFHRREPYVKAMRNYQLKHKLHRRIKWLGYRYNVQDFMTAFDICVVPSLEEPLGLAAIEAFAAGTPVVASRVGGLPEIVQDHQTGRLIPAGNPESIAQAIIELARDKELRWRLGESGQEMVRQKFDPIQLAKTVEQKYIEVVKSRRRSAA